MFVILFSSTVSVACSFSGICTRHHSPMVSSFLYFMCVFEKGFFFTMLLVTGLIR
jgi:hypothetical protein